ncbi:FAD-dependent oxidoreductase [Nocardioides sp.]|uniref:FAD-dependent oxidoreductase n=1 Tax=Nocardioides sp. TaxID=35761 RepID=UPI002B2714E3|nr:FAD-dependent oxidoreductase [Nocardioides sp.]
MTPTPQPDRPLVVVGAGPIGLAAAAHAHERGLAVVVLEAGESVGHAVAEWGHVRLFSPWSELVDDAAGRLLEAQGWTRPDPDGLPTGAEWVERYLAPLAEALRHGGVEVRAGHRVVGVAREGRDRLVAIDRADVPFVVHVETASGHEVLRASAVIDASGTWGQPGPLGADGYPAAGERACADQISYGVPDVTDPTVRARLAGRHVVVAGAGASAQNVLVALGELAEADPSTRITWLLRRGDATKAFGGGDADELAARGQLSERARGVAESAKVARLTGFRTAAVRRDDAGALVLTAVNGRELTDVDEVVVVTGYRPDHSWLSEVHLDLDGELSAPRLLAPEIHPAHHSCGTVSPHGADLLRQPESGLYLAGMKSYGRAPSFLALTGFEQVRSIVAEVAGDHEAAARVELTLPESGVCGAGPAFDEQVGGCCGAPTPVAVGVGTTR